MERVGLQRTIHPVQTPVKVPMLHSAVLALALIADGDVAVPAVPLAATAVTTTNWRTTVMMMQYGPVVAELPEPVLVVVVAAAVAVVSVAAMPLQSMDPNLEIGLVPEHFPFWQDWDGCLLLLRYK